MFQLTVGYIAGIIAAGIFVARLWAPNVLTFIISGLLRDRSTAATWNVAARAFQRSHWPDLLRADSSYNNAVRKDILILAKLSTLMGFVIAIAGVVTPLGLYQALDPADGTSTPFEYLKDTSPFGYGTPPRSNLSFNRVCESAGPIPCPFSDTIAVFSTDGNWLNYSYPYSYDRGIPQRVTDTYSSGVDNKTTISNYFDIQWRRYLTTSDDNYNNGSTYLVSSFRNMDSILLNNATEPVEGLIVDTKKGGIGFRNHTVPPGFPHGVTWQEDILFVEPESLCIDLNLTIDFSIAISPNYSTLITDAVLTDRGGFVNINHTYPEPNLTNAQINQDLWGRAYKAAWLNNVYTMLYYNVTSDRNESQGTHAFAYLNSELGKTYPLGGSSSSSSANYDSLTLIETFGDYLKLDSFDTTSAGIANSSDPASSGPATNPFNVNKGNFSDIMLLCSGAGSGDYANITNVYASCGLMHGVPQRQDDGDKLTFDSGSRWSQKLYSCVTTTKATIKTVSFNYNGTANLLKDLMVTDIQDKSYSDENDMPLWGVENTGNGFMEDEISLIWGLVSSDYENNPNVSTVRQPSLYLPGYNDGNTGSGFAQIGAQNLPGSDFYSQAMWTAYNVGDDSYSSSTAQVDYSGEVNMAMWTLWQNLTITAETAGLIPNLIWTDNAAAAVVGTKGVLGPGNAAQHNLAPLTVVPTLSRIKYHWPFAIPAFITLLLLIIITLLAFLTVCLRGASTSRMSLHLQKISPGRIFTTFLYPEQGGMEARSYEWSRHLGKKVIDLSGAYPVAAEMMEMVPPEKEARVTEYQHSTSGEISAAEGERLVSSPSHARDQSQGDLGNGGYGFAPSQEYRGAQQPPGPGVGVRRY